MQVIYFLAAIVCLFAGGWASVEAIRDRKELDGTDKAVIWTVVASTIVCGFYTLGGAIFGLIS